MTGKFQIPSNIPIRKLDDHRILVKFLKDFDQNSGGLTIQMTMKFFVKNSSLKSQKIR